jgi:acetyl-CoA acetyltransferase
MAGEQRHVETDATSPAYLRDKYAIVGVGETPYMRGSGISTRALGTWAVRNAMADAGLKPADIDGMLSYHFVLGDSTYVPFIAGDLGLRLNFYMDVQGGGSSTEALVGVAMGLIEAGMCKAVVIYRAVNGFSQVRAGGSGARAVAAISNEMLHARAYGMHSAGNQFAFTFMRHMFDYGTRPEQVAAVRGQIAGYKVPKDVKFVADADIPRSTTGKVKRHELESWLLAERTSSTPGR